VFWFTVLTFWILILMVMWGNMRHGAKCDTSFLIVDFQFVSQLSLCYIKRPHFFSFSTVVQWYSKILMLNRDFALVMIEWFKAVILPNLMKPPWNSLGFYPCGAKWMKNNLQYPLIVDRYLLLTNQQYDKTQNFILYLSSLDYMG